MAAVQKRIIIGLEDLSTIYLHCKTCSGEIVFPLQSTDTANSRDLPRSCPLCNTYFAAYGEQNTAILEEVIVHNIRELLNTQDNRKAQLRFEINAKDGQDA